MVLGGSSLSQERLQGHGKYSLASFTKLWKTMALKPGAMLGREAAEKTLSFAPIEVIPVDGPPPGNDVHIDYRTPRLVLDPHPEPFFRDWIGPCRIQDSSITRPVIEKKKGRCATAHVECFPAYQTHDPGDHFPITLHSFWQSRDIQ